jgi:hypothetical protein
MERAERACCLLHCTTCVTEELSQNQGASPRAWATIITRRNFILLRPRGKSQDISDFESRQRQDFSLHHSTPTGSRVHPASYATGSGGDFPGGGGLEDEHSPLSDVEARSSGVRPPWHFFYLYLGDRGEAPSSRRVNNRSSLGITGCLNLFPPSG